MESNKLNMRRIESIKLHLATTTYAVQIKEFKMHRKELEETGFGKEIKMHEKWRSPAFDRAHRNQIDILAIQIPAERDLALLGSKLAASSFMSGTEGEAYLLVFLLPWVASYSFMCCSSSVTWMHLYLYSKQEVVGYLMLRWYGEPPWTGSN